MNQGSYFFLLEDGRLRIWIQIRKAQNPTDSDQQHWY
jgi:hypothetical protein